MVATCIASFSLHVALPILQDTDAVLVTCAGAFGATLTVSVIAAVPDAGMAVVLVHVTTWPTAEQVNPPHEPLTNARPAGSVSDTVIVPLLAAPPPLLTVSA